MLRGLDNYVEEPREDLSYLFISDESEKSNISLPSKGREDVLPGFEWSPSLNSPPTTAETDELSFSTILRLEFLVLTTSRRELSRDSFAASAGEAFKTEGEDNRLDQQRWKTRFQIPSRHRARGEGREGGCYRIHSFFIVDQRHVIYGCIRNVSN